MPDSAAAAGQRPGPAGRTRRGSMLARAGHMEYDRILFFSDAVFAIAITLLIVDLPVQVERASSSAGQHAGLNAGADLRNAVPGIEGFAISFAVIGLFWLGHHALFRHIKAIDRPLMLLNLLFLGTIAFLPYPTELLSSVSSGQAPAVIFYASCCAAAGVTETVVWLYATHSKDGLVQGISPEMKRLYLLRTARAPVVFLLSIPIAAVWPRQAIYSWLGIWLLAVVIDRRYGQHESGVPDEPADPADG